MSRAETVEIERIRAEYDRRAREIPANRYGWQHPVNFFFHAQLCRVLIRALAREDRFPLDGKRVLDVGCGSGKWLLEFAQWGADASGLCGIDLDEARLAEARRKLPASDLRCGDARRLPWPDNSFDLVTQFVVFTSVLDGGVQERMAGEMIRVLKPGGAIVWYDFRVDNPRNQAVRGVPAWRVDDLFGSCDLELRSVTLAPPIARRVVPISWNLGLLLEALPFLRTHYLGLIRKPGVTA